MALNMPVRMVVDPDDSYPARNSEVTVTECPVCFAVVRKDRLGDHHQAMAHPALYCLACACGI
jgi:hypothetical protein